MDTGKTIVGLGEALFDLFPSGAKLGGAPLNVAVHAHQLGNEGIVVSRVGRDEFAALVREELRERGMMDRYLQEDTQHPTGTVKVDLDEHGQPRYTITAGAAWDFMVLDEASRTLARRCDGVCFGTLAQREEASRRAILGFVGEAPQAIRLFDVNLRQEYFDLPTLTRGCELASAVKLNESESGVLGGLMGLGDEGEDVAAALVKKFTLDWVAMTRGERGTIVITPEGRHEGKPESAEAGGDAVGAGDATSAALLHGAARGWPWDRTLGLANALGAFVASRSGACPALPGSIRAMAG